MVDVMINYVAVLIAGIAAMVFGAIWHSPNVFGATWAKLNGFTAKDMQKGKAKGGMGGKYFWQFVAILVMAYVLSVFVNFAQAADFLSGMAVGFWAWLGFVATVLIASVLWEGKPFKLYLLNSIYFLITLTIMGGILAIW